MDTTIVTLPKSLSEPDIVVMVLLINCLLVIGHVKIYGRRVKKQRIQVRKKEHGDKVMSCGCANNMSNKYGGSMYGKKKADKKAYSTMKPREGGMKKPSVGGKKLYTYKDI